MSLECSWWANSDSRGMTVGSIRSLPKSVGVVWDWPDSRIPVESTESTWSPSFRARLDDWWEPRRTRWTEPVWERPLLRRVEHTDGVRDDIVSDIEIGGSSSGLWRSEEALNKRPPECTGWGWFMRLMRKMARPVRVYESWGEVQPKTQQSTELLTVRSVYRITLHHVYLLVPE